MNDKIFTRFCILLAALTSTAIVEGQKTELTIKDLVGLTTIPAERFESAIAKKGFRSQIENVDDELSNAFYKFSKDKSIQYCLERNDVSDHSSVIFRTNSVKAFKTLRAQLEKNGFTFALFDSTKELFPAMYQMGSFRIFPSLAKQGDEKLYCLQIENKELPQASTITYAEDLRQIISHEYLASVFGPSKVLRDRLLFSEKEVVRCSVLYPNTNLQVIFVWKDEANYKDIAYLLIGGQSRTQASSAFDKSIQMNKWRSRQGVYLGMSLRDLELLNEAPVEFFGWETDQPGIVSPTTNGKIDFKRLGVQLTCLDCNEDKYYSRNKMLSSTKMISLNARVYVSTLVVLPEE